MRVAEKSEKIQFRFLPETPLRTRLTWIAVLVLVGFAIQLCLSVLLGWAVLLAGCLLGVIRGRSTKPKARMGGEWKTTTIEELEDIERLSRRIKAWRGRSDVFRITSGTGCGMVLLALLVLAGTTIAIWATLDRGHLSMGAPMRGGSFSALWVLDFLTMLIPIWFAGWLTAWEPPELPRKARYVLNIYSTYKSEPEFEFRHSLYVSGKKNRRVPWDCRLLVEIRDAPEGFMGIQVQVSLNDVQGTKYPYCYAVIIARKEFALGRRAIPHLDPPPQGGLLGGILKSKNERREGKFPRFKGSIAEVDSESDVDVVVVRQVTTGKGYHTTEQAAMIVFGNALALARLILGKETSGPTADR